MPLTPQEIQAARSQYGIDTTKTSASLAPSSSQNSSALTGDALGNFLNDKPITSKTSSTDSTDNIFTRGKNAIKDAASSLKDSFTKRAKDITDTTMKTSNELYDTKVSDAPVTKQNILDYLTKSETDNKDNPLQQMQTKYLAPIRNALNTVGQVAGSARRHSC